MCGANRNAARALGRRAASLVRRGGGAGRSFGVRWHSHRFPTRQRKLPRTISKRLGSPRIGCGRYTLAVANPEHLAKLIEGRAAWNAWYSDHAFPADLSGADLRGRKFHQFDLRIASFRRANLAEATLSIVDLAGADFSNASLIKADLTGSNCAYANFTNADLTDADLSLANFHSAKVDGTNFTNTLFFETHLTGLDLSTAGGLNTARYLGWSSIGIDTFFNSGGLHEDFLRACGVPEEFITYAGSLIGKPIEYYSCFISYSTKDDDFARRLHADLQAMKIRTFFAPEDLKIGDRLRLRIDESIRGHDKLVLILSESSIKSPWVQREVEIALDREDREKRDLLFPIRLDDSVFSKNDAWASEICRRNIGDFRHWDNHEEYTKSFNRLVGDLKKEGPIVMKA